MHSIDQKPFAMLQKISISISYEFLIRQRTLKKIKYINVSTKKIFCKSGNIDIKNNYFLSSK